MAIELKTYQIVLTTSSTIIIPAVAGGKRIRISSITAGNDNVNTKYFNLYKLPAGISSETRQYRIAGGDIKLLGTSSTSGGGYFSFGNPFHLNTNDKLTGTAEENDCITVFVSAIEEDI